MRASALAAALLALAGCIPREIPAPPPPVLDPDLGQRGALLFLDPRVSGDGSRACATCHPGGGTDRRAWREGEEAAHGSEGAIDTPPLWGAWETPPWLRDGSANTMRAAVERMLAVEMRGGTLSPRDLAALETYVLSIPRFDAGRVDESGAPREPATLRAKRGFEVFAKAKCATCHPPPRYAWGRASDVRTGGRFDTPSLRGVSRTGPWAHDGRFTTLEDVARAMLAARSVTVTDLELDYLLEYLKLL